MAPPTEPSRVVASELGKDGKNLEGTGAKFCVPDASKFFSVILEERLRTFS